MSFEVIDDTIYMSPHVMTLESGDNNNVEIQSSNFQVVCSTDNDTITGLRAKNDYDGGQVWITNAIPDKNLILKANSSSSDAGYRFIILQDVILKPLESQHFGFSLGQGWIPISGAVALNIIPETWVSGVRKTNVKQYFTSANVSSGSATFNLTDDGTPTGNAVFTNIYTESINLFTLDSTAQYQFGNVSVAGNKKTLTVDVSKLGDVVLGVIQFVSSADSQTIYLQVKGD